MPPHTDVREPHGFSHLAVLTVGITTMRKLNLKTLSEDMAAE